MKKLTFVALLLATFSPLQIAKAVSISPVGHATDEYVGTTRYIYFPILGNAADNCDQSRTYPSTLTTIDPTSGDLLFYVTATEPLSDITGNSTVNSGDVSIRVELNSSSTPIALDDRGNGYNDGATGVEVNYGNEEGATRLIGISLPNNVGGSYGVCGLPSVWGTMTNCRAGLSTPPSLSLRIGVIRQGQAFSDTTDEDAEDITIRLIDCPPHTSTVLDIPTMNFDLTPGDQRMVIKNATSEPTDPFGISTVVAYGTRGSTSVTLSNSLPAAGGFQKVIGSSASAIPVDGLENDVTYCVSLGYVNKGGLVATDTSWSETLPAIDSSRNCVTPSKVDGFLDRSKCFIATAAYGNEWDARLAALRMFRDQILLKTSVGTAFVNWYYNWSPPKARWLLERPRARFAVRLALVPLVFFAKSVLFLADALSVSEAQAQTLQSADEVQPYIESVKKKYGVKPPREEPEALSSETTVQPEAGPIQPYIDKMKAQIRESEAESRSEKTGGSSDSIQPYIETVKKGKELEPKYRTSVRNAAGIAVLASSDFDIKSNQVQANSFDTVYEPNRKYVPGVDLFYEYQFLRDRTWGSLGVVSHLKVFVARGKGIFTNRQERSDDTKFRFTAVPVSLGLGYRFLMGRLVVPFAQLSMVGTPILESRDDQKPSRRSISHGYTSTLGVALSLDWISRRDAWTRYDAYGALHTYLTLQWERARALGGPVAVNYNALFAGLGFEF